MPKPNLYLDVPSCWSDYLDTGIYDEAVDTAPPGSILVEVGSFWGKGAIYLAEAAKYSKKSLRVYSIDIWAAEPRNNQPMFDRACGGIEPQIHGEHHDSLFETFSYFIGRSHLSPDPLRIMRMDSLEAAGFFHGKRIHFLFLDDDHAYGHVLSELRAWEPLVTAGGIIAGHDYAQEFGGVIEATTEYFGYAPEVKGTTWIVRKDIPG